ncbi:MAG: oxidoreductase [Promethearchaeota archaeon]
MKFVKLFEPLKIGNIEIKNRLVMAAMHLGYTYDGFLNDKLLNLYEERAKGGVGLIILGGCQVEARGAGPGFVAIDDDKFIPGFKTFAEKVHAQGAKCFAQFYHAGAYAFSFNKEDPAVSASAVRSNFTKKIPEELSVDGIKTVLEHHVEAAERVRASGFDGVELLGSAGYLINQFLSPITNKRTDKYGGSLENRLRYPLELIRLVKEKVGKDIVVGLRISGDDLVPGSNTYKEVAVIAKNYAEAGLDYINVTAGWHESRIPQIPMMVPNGNYAYLAENIKNVVDIPVFASNRINDPYVAEQILRDEKADAICMARPYLADPYLPNKIKENRLWDLRRCIACNQGCFDYLFGGKAIECMRNYETSREGTIDLNSKTENPMNVLIIGSGPGGLEAARVATVLGHNVTILEKKDYIGGQANLSYIPPGRHQIRDIVDYYTAQIEHLNIDLKLETEATSEKINMFNPDAVIFATGVNWNIPDIPGLKDGLGKNIFLAEQVLNGDTPIGKNVVVVGGSGTGVETAIWAAEQGALDSDVARFIRLYDLMPRDEVDEKWLRGNRKVTIIEVLPRIGTNIGKSTRGFLMGYLNKLGINAITSANIEKFDGKTIQYEIGSDTKILEDIDTFILATGVKPNRALHDEVKSSDPKFKIYKIGDCKKPRTMLEAIHEGFKTAYNLDK